MAPEQLFLAVNLVAMLSWVLLAAWPRHHRIPQIVAGLAVPAALAAVYVAIIATKWGESAGGFSSLTDVATLFGNRWLLLAGWTHYLAFDLFVGGWEVRDALERGISHLLVLPCLVLTFLFGPDGWLLYLAIRSVHGQAKTKRIPLARLHTTTKTAEPAETRRKAWTPRSTGTAIEALRSLRALRWSSWSAILERARGSLN